MPKTLRVASIQMDSAPALTSERLSRAGDLVAEAASSGASLVVLPEIFNTGYEYHDRNYALAETMDGETATWMKQVASEHDVHIAGSFMLLDNDDVYNTALLIAPDGRTWRYDKQFPYIWERAYFREGNRITVADTDLGKLGMMICWDASHSELWDRYAGKVDAMIVMSNPPRLHDFDLIFPDGERVNARELNPLFAEMAQYPVFFSGEDMNRNAEWMQVPIIATAGSGQMRSKLPMAKQSLATLLASKPDLWGNVLEADEVWIEAGYDAHTKVVNQRGEIIAQVTDSGDAFTIAEVELADETPQPLNEQPKMSAPTPIYLAVDAFASNVMIQHYRKGLRKQHGKKMAPRDTRTLHWGIGLAVTGILGLIIGRLSKK